MSNDETPQSVTEGDIAAAIVGEYYFTAYDGVAGVQALKAGEYLSRGLALTGVMPESAELPAVVVQAMPRLGDVTLCVLVLRNAFVVVGKSIPVAPENFNAELGRKYARQDAIGQCWPLLGYALRERLHAEKERTPIWPRVAAAAVLDQAPPPVDWLGKELAKHPVNADAHLHLAGMPHDAESQRDLATHVRMERDAHSHERVELESARGEPASELDVDLENGDDRSHVQTGLQP